MITRGFGDGTILTRGLARVVRILAPVITFTKKAMTKTFKRGYVKR